MGGPAQLEDARQRPNSRERCLVVVAHGPLSRPAVGGYWPAQASSSPARRQGRFQLSAAETMEELSKESSPQTTQVPPRTRSTAGELNRDKSDGSHHVALFSGKPRHGSTISNQPISRSLKSASSIPSLKLSRNEASAQRLAEMEENAVQDSIYVLC